MSNYLLEIGVEEFPAKFIKPTQKQFNNLIDKFLKENNYAYESLEINSTPRRFAILIEGIEPVQENSVVKIKGPAKKIAFDDEGNPTRALEGFMKSKGISLSDIVYEEMGGEEYVFANIKNETKNLKDLLIEEIPSTIKSISNPRQMRWGGKNLRFLRPIRWIVSLLDDEILEFELEGIEVSNLTKGHRTLGSHEIEINSIEEYKEKLAQNFVIISEEERRSMILKGINRLAKEKGGNYHHDEDLLEEVININEYPTPFIGEINNEYLVLPKEVIVTPMKDHQRYFPVDDENGKLLPFFIAVRNGDNKGISNVVEGNKKVLVARLEDAKFFFNKDISKPFEDYVPELEHLGYHEGLGNMLDKTYRLMKLVESIGNDFACGNEVKDIAKRAAFLSKADLVTSTVIEFTELQGIMGRIFAEHSGENPLVARAIEEQYMPVKSGGELPSTTGGILLSLADKIDNIAGLYSQGIEVTGSQDMYGQRRAVLGIIHILLKNKIKVSLREIIKDALYNYVENFGETFDYNEVTDKIETFISARFKNLMLDEGYRYDIVDAVLNTYNNDICEVYAKVKLFDEKAKNKYQFESNIERFVRIVNISQKAETTEIKEEFLLEEDKEIYGQLSELDAFDKLYNEGKYDDAFSLITDLAKSLNNYLDNTLIMAEDENVKRNRLSIVKTVSNRIKRMFNPIEIVR